jgi:hypothetical protein
MWGIFLKPSLQHLTHLSTKHDPPLGDICVLNRQFLSSDAKAMQKQAHASVRQLRSSRWKTRQSLPCFLPCVPSPYPFAWNPHQKILSSLLRHL